MLADQILLRSMQQPDTVQTSFDTNVISIQTAHRTVLQESSLEDLMKHMHACTALAIGSQFAEHVDECVCAALQSSQEQMLKAPAYQNKQLIMWPWPINPIQRWVGNPTT